MIRLDSHGRFGFIKIHMESCYRSDSNRDCTWSNHDFLLRECFTS